MYKLISSYVLITLFTVMFSYETVEYFCGKTYEHTSAVSGILELEEETGSSEETREENDEELKMADDFCTEITPFRLGFTIERRLTALNQHFISSDHSNRIFSPPEIF